MASFGDVRNIPHHLCIPFDLDSIDVKRTNDITENFYLEHFGDDYLRWTTELVLGRCILFPLL